MDVLSTSFYDHWWGCLVMPVVSLGLELLWICQNGSLEIHEFSGWKAHGSWERTLGNIGAIPILYAPCMACMVYTNCSAIVCLHALAIFGRICWYRINMNQPFQHQGAYGFVRGYHGIQFFWMWKKMMNNWISVVFQFPLNSQTIPRNGCRWTFHPCRSRTCLMHCAAVCAASFCRTATRCPVVDGMNEADLDDVQHDWTVAHMDMQGRRGWFHFISLMYIENSWTFWMLKSPVQKPPCSGFLKSISECCRSMVDFHPEALYVTRQKLRECMSPQLQSEICIAVRLGWIDGIEEL